MRREPTADGTSEGTFHEGELALQREAGVAERMERLGAQVIRDYMPDQHRSFFELLPFVIVGSLDAQGQPAASLLAAPPGFAWSPEPRVLRVDALPVAGDPLEDNLRPGAPLGLLGIQAQTRRRNRVNGTVLARDAGGFELSVRQSFGNCPKYIHPREASYVGSVWRGPPAVTSGIGERERALMQAADTFFLASAHPGAARGEHRAHGVDVSHRGGPPGFVCFTGQDRCSIPDFRGNNFFNTLGNLRLSGAAGLLFLDFARGDVLQIEASASVSARAHPRASPDGTGRCLELELRRARWFAGVSPLRFGTPAADGE